MADCGPEEDHLRVIEFYSGIGGWSFALQECGIHAARVVAAHDVSTTSNEVYRHNHGLQPSQKPIENLAKEQVDGRAEIWMMSPPCQPHTRQRASLENQALDEHDPRSQSFLHLRGLLEQLHDPPQVIVLENVVGFHDSTCCGLFISTLLTLGYAVEQFHLSPRDFCFPNERPRYYMVARRISVAAADSDEFSSSSREMDAPVLSSLPSTKKRKTLDDSLIVRDHLELPAYIDASLENPPPWLEPWQVPRSTLEKDAAWCFDIVQPSDDRTACFTKSYGRYVKGTGSILYVPKRNAQSASSDACCSGPDSLMQPQDRNFGKKWQTKILNSGELRYFTPREVASLMGFPSTFEFPESVKPRKAYEMLGNSLHVGVAAQVVAYALQEG